ncbi:MFS transporter [Mycobacterium deserti]|uniref:MFS transporter n=1 Tax=Mycobacterium deserti TaxID=2978347 RepID=A0ABT2MLF9_9MYCO|nr:MFS transporter [Mycobacterium deserti]MCT7661786.1 MFS transporter [Mycobacterium deserti]
MATTIERTSPEGLGAAAPALLSLAAAAFVAVTTEMLPVGLLPDIGAAFAVPESVIGLLVSLYAVMVAALAVPLTLLTARFARKPLLLATLAGYVVSNAMVAAAPVFAVVAVGRTLGGLTHALFFSLLIGYTPRLVSRAHLGRALSLVSGGASAGLVLGVPLSTSLGTAIGWRAAFAVLAGVAALTFVLVCLLLPGVENGPPGHTGDSVGRGALAAVAASNTLTFLGHFTLYTFITLVLLGSGIAPAMVGPILLVCGACGLISLWYAGRNLDRNPRRTVVVIFAVFIGAIVALGGTWPAGVAVVVAAIAWNGAFGAVPSIYQTHAVRTHAVTPELAGAWVNATANVGIAGGAAIGAGLLDSAGIWVLPWVSVALIGLGLLVILMSPRAFPSRAG